jgi:hypothetical protein
MQQLAGMPCNKVKGLLNETPLIRDADSGRLELLSGDRGPDTLTVFREKRPYNPNLTEKVIEPS